MNVEKQIRIIVAEDNDNIRKLIINILTNVGFTDITEAENGRIAWEKIQKDQYDLVLTDWMMPEMDGLELLKKIRTGSGDIKHTPILMITASDKSDDILQAAKWNINGYIVKPFSVKTILSKIKEAID
ncbi:MAG: response regulator [Proteobacteria bacterium]|nr:response regulator [Pseudomonadota bacterium]